MKKFIKYRLSKNEARVPFCPEVRDFIGESLKCQTLFANCEGFYPRRIIKLEEETKLNDFIYDTMYYNEFQKEINKNIHVSQICNEIRSLSEKHNLDGEIHLSVVWTYYFEYATKTTKGVPVFKIFKKKFGNETVFLDIFLKTYESWNCYLETAEFPQSFLCVPRHGEYHFDNDSGLLLLEFVQSKKLESNKTNSEIIRIFKSTPFSVRVVCPLLRKIKTELAHAKDKITAFVHTLCSYLDNYKGCITNATLFLFIIFMKMKESGLSSLNWKSIYNQGFMLLNICFKETDFRNFNEPTFWQNPQITIIPGLSKISEYRRVMGDINDEGARFIELLKSQDKNYLEIFKLFFSIFIKSGTFLNELLVAFPHCHILIVLNKTLKVLSTVLSMTDSEGFYDSLCIEGKPANEIVERNLTLLNVQEPSCSSASENQIQQWSMSHTEIQNFNYSIRHRFFEKVTSNLTGLETSSCTKLCSLFYEEIGNEILKSESRPPDVSFRNISLQIGIVGGFVIYLFPKASIPCLTVILRELMGREFSFKPQEVWIFEIVDFFHESLGTVFFLTELSAVGVFPLKVIEK